MTQKAGAAKAGIQAGDTITSWSQANRERVIVSPLDLVWVERERGPRGPVTLAGLRESAVKKWILNSTPWGITAGPKFSGAQAIDARMKQLAASNQFDKLAEFCRAACGGINTTSPLRYWPFFAAARLLAASQHWKAADEFYARAIDESRRATGNLPGQIYEEWGEVHEHHKDWIIARKYYSEAFAEDRKIDPESLTVAYDLQKLALMQFRLGDVLGAERFATQALRIRRKLCPSTPQMATILNYMGVFAQENGDLDS
ncbi:MAG: tetratricopeptide repeat protein, partial [Candidatus Acidiferrales bacterium]